MDFRIFLLVITIVLFLFIVGGFWGAMWIPTRKGDYKTIAGIINLRPGMVFYDLGSGSGNLLFYLSQKYNIKCVGIEVSPVLYLYSKLKSLFFKKVEIKYGDFFKHNLSEADIIYIFLRPRMYTRLRKKIKKIKKKKLLILLSAWPFKNVKVSKISRGDKGNLYYLYKKANL